MVFSYGESVTYMSQKGPGVGKGMLDCVEDIFVGVKSQYWPVNKQVTLNLCTDL